MSKPAYDWRKLSGITECCECDGAGYTMSLPGGHANDPDNWAIDCEDCEGTGHFACDVCGFAVRISGYDCVVCDMLGEVPDNLVNAETEVAVSRAVSAHIAMRAKCAAKDAA